MDFFFCKKSKFSVPTDDGWSEEKPIKDMSRDELIDLVGSLMHKISVLCAENQATVHTMNKFLAKDHGGLLDKVMQKNDEVMR